eukprot:10311199-Prorocentrum_lima.AAC.1
MAPGAGGDVRRTLKVAIARVAAQRRSTSTRQRPLTGLSWDPVTPLGLGRAVCRPNVGASRQ